MLFTWYCPHRVIFTVTDIWHWALCPNDFLPWGHYAIMSKFVISGLLCEDLVHDYIPLPQKHFCTRHDGRKWRKECFCQIWGVNEVCGYKKMTIWGCGKWQVFQFSWSSFVWPIKIIKCNVNTQKFPVLFKLLQSESDGIFTCWKVRTGMLVSKKMYLALAYLG